MASKFKTGMKVFHWKKPTVHYRIVALARNAEMDHSHDTWVVYRTVAAPKRTWCQSYKRATQIMEDGDARLRPVLE